MVDAAGKMRFWKRGGIQTRLLWASLGLVLLVFVLSALYLLSPLPARHLSRLASSTLQQQVTVKEARLSGRTLVLKGVRLSNPAGFKGGALVVADTVAIRPFWLDLFRGRQRFELLSVSGGAVSLEKNAKGTWNFEALQKTLAARKRPERAPETVIGRFVLREGAITVQGQGVSGIDLQVFNLATGGSRQARIDLAFEDAARNRYLLKGTARPGDEAALDLSLTGTSLSLKGLATLFNLESAAMLAAARGSLQANAVLAKGELHGTGVFLFQGVQLPAAAGSYPVRGSARFNGVYSVAEDTAYLEEGSLVVEDTGKLQAEGSVRGVTKEKEFAFLFGMEGLDLALLNVFLPPASQGGLVFGGRLRCESLRIEGSGADGVESVAGTLQLSEGALAGKGGLLAAGLSGRADLSRQGRVVEVAGKLTQRGPQPKALVEAAELPFQLALSPQLKLLRARSGGLFARVMGVTVAGAAAYDVGSDVPLTAGLRLSSANLARLNPQLQRFDVRAVSGTASGSVELAGKDAQRFEADATLKLAGLKGRRGGEPLAAKDAAVTAKLNRQGGVLLAQGEARLEGLSYAALKGQARFGYRLDDSMLYLDKVEGALGGTRFAALKLTGRVPEAQPQGEVTRYPLQLDLEGGSVRQGELAISNLSGRVRGNLATLKEEKWLEGTAEFSSRQLAWQGSGVAAPVLRASFARQGAHAELRGSAMGGSVAASASFRPFAMESGGPFELTLKGADAAQAARLMPKGAPYRPAEGSLDLHLMGGFAGRDAAAANFEARGRDLSLADRHGRNVFSGAALSVTGRVSREALSVADASLSPGREVTLRLKGEIAQPFSPKRRGRLGFSMPETSLSALADSVINLLPRALQEATLAGRVAADGTLELGEGRTLLEGGVAVKGGRVEGTAQKLLIADVDGRIPFSLDLGGKGGGRPREAREFSRQNYQRLLAELRALPPGQDRLSVGKVALGTLELGRTTLGLRAGNGLLELSPVRSSLYEGEILGTGYLATGKKPSYRADLLVHGVSLRKLCRSIPNLEGYISGRVDGVISVRGVGGGLEGLAGFVDLWAREGGGEKMLVSKEFLQRLAKQKLSGLFLGMDRPYDKAEIKGTLERGDLAFEALQIVNKNLFGVKDLNVSIAPTQNRIALDHLLESIKEAAVRGGPATGAPPAEKKEKPEPMPEFRWEQ